MKNDRISCVCVCVSAAMEQDDKIYAYGAHYYYYFGITGLRAAHVVPSAMGSFKNKKIILKILSERVQTYYAVFFFFFL